MNILDTTRTAIGNSFRSKLRTSLTVVAIFIGAFTLTITTAIGTGIASYIDAQIASIGAPDVLTITQAAADATALDDGPPPYDPEKAVAAPGFAGDGSDYGAGLLTAEDLESIRRIDGILGARAVVQVAPEFIEYDGNGKFEVTVNPTIATINPQLAAGRQLSESGGNQVLLMSSYLQNLGFASAERAVGETVVLGVKDYLGELHKVEATVVGVQNESLFGGAMGLNQPLTERLRDIQTSGDPSGASGFYLATAVFDEAATEAQQAALKSDLADAGYSALTVADQIGQFQAVIGGIIGVLNAFAVIALIAAGFGIVNTLLMSVQERTREIGLMKAMGMGGGSVYALFSMEAVFIGFVGSVLGAMGAIGVGAIANNVLDSTLLASLDGLQVLLFTPLPVAMIIGLVMLIAFLAGTLPARRAARQNPIDALRYE